MQPGAFGVSEARRRGFLDHLLVAPLHRAVAFAERDHLAAPVAEDLHLDMARGLDVLLDEHAGVREVRRAQPRDGLEGGGQLPGIAAQRHADPAAAGRALEHHRITDPSGGFQRGRRVGQQAGARQQRHTLLARDLAGTVLEPEGAHLRGARPDEAQPGRLAGLGECRVLGQEAVAGMDRLRAGLARGGQDRLHPQVAVGGAGGADADRLVGQADMRACRSASE